MTHVLGPGQRSLLRDLAAHRTLLAFDFDGTLAPIVRDHRAARLGPATTALLRELSRRWPCAVISGRSREDVARRVAGTGIRRVVGSHGAEPTARAPRSSRAVAAWARALGPLVASIPGAELERKPLSLSVHFRNVRFWSVALRRVAGRAGELRGVRLVPGKKVLNLVPARSPDKGEALARMVRRGRFERVLFAGDDVTDEDVFRRRFPVPAVTIRIGARGRSAASHGLRSQASMDALLAALVRARAKLPSHSAPAKMARPEGRE